MFSSLKKILPAKTRECAIIRTLTIRQLRRAFNHPRVQSNIAVGVKGISAALVFGIVVNSSANAYKALKESQAKDAEIDLKDKMAELERDADLAVKKAERDADLADKKAVRDAYLADKKAVRDAYLADKNAEREMMMEEAKEGKDYTRQNGIMI